jgi:hypothetical protein
MPRQDSVLAALTELSDVDVLVVVREGASRSER